jgi:nicotinate-nucleotide adenylyltransferase
MRAPILDHSMKIGLYFGSFNPIHNGHLHVARAALLQQHRDEVWFVISPQNPFKENEGLAPEKDRLRMAELACDGQRGIRVSDIEFGLPSYTINTIQAIREKHPEHSFQLIIGEDNLEGLHRWKEFDALLSLVEVVVYLRAPEKPMLPHYLEPYKERIFFLAGELVPISATDIRTKLHESKSIDGLTPTGVIEYIQKNGLYA